MAQEVQIVPKYLHSHVETYVNDYTQFNDETSKPVDNSSKFISVFRSSMGIDNVLIKKNDLSDFKATYGKSDYKKYGQPLMMPLAMLDSGSATVFCMRVMPEDAFAANSILCLKYKPDTTTGKFSIKYEARHIDKDSFDNTSLYSSNATFKKQLAIYAEGNKTVDAETGELKADTDGWFTVPILTFRMAGRGTYGNDYRWRIAQNVDYEYDYGIKMFSFEVLSSVNGLQKKATYVGSMATSPSYSSLTLINDILDDKEIGAAIMDVQVLEDNYELVYDTFKKFVEGLDETLQDENGVPDIDKFDPFFGVGIANQTKHKNIEIIPADETENTISVDGAQGVTLAGGDDGVFATGSDQDIYNAEVAAYTKAFSGDLDPKILSTRRVPCDALLDANYPFEVKQVLADLAITRDSCICYLDAGTDTTLAQIDNIVDEYSVFNSRNIVKEFQHYTIRDIETKKKCEVTITYFYAQQLPVHYRNNGSWTPFVKANAQLYGHVKDTLQPVIDDIGYNPYASNDPEKRDMNEIKELLYTNRINYFEAIEENVFQRCSQSTAQMENSDLVEENNMNTLFVIKKTLENDAWRELYTFTSASQRALFTQVEKDKFSSWTGIRFDTFDITFDVNDFEAERSIVHCYVSVQFRNLMKRTIIEIDVNKRNFTA